MSRGARILYLTGKGGVGKTFLAERLANKLVELTGRVGFVSMPGLPSTDMRLADGRGSIDSVVLDERAALARLVARVVGFRSIADRLLDSRTFTALAAAAPGVREFLAVHFLQEFAAGDRYRWIVVDGPATGHSLALLGAPARVARITSFGPVARLARAATSFVSDQKSFVVLIVTTPEELAAREAVEAWKALRALAIVPRAVLVNGVYPDLAAPDQAATLLGESPDADVLLYLKRQQRQRAFVERLASDVGSVDLVPRDLPGHEGATQAVDEVAQRLVRELEG